MARIILYDDSVPAGPFVALTMSESKSSATTPNVALNLAYIRAIERAGAVPLLIPPGVDAATSRVLLDRASGLLLPGGPDLHPRHYGQSPHPSVRLQTISADRDRLELDLAREALNRDLPVLAICRGAQVLNVAAGGTLVQDIPSLCPSPLSHRQATPRGEVQHAVSLVGGSMLANLFGSPTIDVNSIHHQAIDRPGVGVVVVGSSPDGVPEAFEMPGQRWCAGVQWHPEELVGSQHHASALFREFVSRLR